MDENDIKDRVQRKGYRNHKLSPEDRARNVEIGVTRGRVEAIFGHMKRLWGEYPKLCVWGLAHADFTGHLLNRSGYRIAN